MPLDTYGRGDLKPVSEHLGENALESIGEKYCRAFGGKMPSIIKDMANRDW